jgi:hypothetical protein
LVSCIYKHGDQLLQDAMCVAVMKEMNYIFKEENVDAEIVLYEVFKNFNLICRKIFFFI